MPPCCPRSGSRAPARPRSPASQGVARGCAPPVRRPLDYNDSSKKRLLAGYSCPTLHDAGAYSFEQCLAGCVAFRRFSATG
eukprot:1149080-Alexandrium_andersonii.AAC.1